MFNVQEEKKDDQRPENMKHKMLGRLKNKSYYNVITCHLNLFATKKSTHSTVLWESMSLFGRFSTALITTFSFPPAQSSCSTVGRRERRNGPKYKSQHQAEKLKKKNPR